MLIGVEYDKSTNTLPAPLLFQLKNQGLHVVSLGVSPFLFRTEFSFFYSESSGTITHDGYAHKLQFSDEMCVNDGGLGEHTCFM